MMRAKLHHSSRRPHRSLQCANVAEPVRLFFQPDTLCDYAFGLMTLIGANIAVVSVDNCILGYVTPGDAAKIGTRKPSEVYVASVMTPESRLDVVSEQARVDDAVAALLHSEFDHIAVISRDKVLAGFVTPASVGRVTGLEIPSPRKMANL